MTEPSWHRREIEFKYNQNWSVLAMCFSTAIVEYGSTDNHLNHLRYFLRMEIVGPLAVLLNQNLWEMTQRIDILTSFLVIYVNTSLRKHLRRS